MYMCKHIIKLAYASSKLDGARHCRKVRKGVNRMGVTTVLHITESALYPARAAPEHFARKRKEAD